MYVQNEYGEAYYMVRSNPANNLLLIGGFIAIAAGGFYLYRRQQKGAAVFGQTVAAGKAAVADLESQMVPPAEGFGLSRDKATARSFYPQAKAVADASGGSGVYEGQVQMLSRPLHLVYTIRDDDTKMLYRVKIPKDGSPASLMGTGMTVTSLPPVTDAE